ncbi:hypothetical protein KFK09_011500 [Dendrobium nobile]|uniref:Uncharacterized protein n=1 Tax=Dendrobium nobile TaxID=94219 RepID=A0A8T3BF37_DENNO|nr:hypothetical protein KFK09_011500 [Dendrobium nobile]
MTVRRLVALDFKVLLEAATNRLNTWGKKCISLEGKLVLVKSAFLSLPQFLSTLLLVPLIILKEFDKMCRGFLWSKSNGNAWLHYASWDLLCKTKIEGGRGLFSAVSKIGPLRAKFAWNFYMKPHSLLNQILRAKYGEDLWSESVKGGSSPTWKIITMGAKFLKNIVRWSVSSGDSINWLNDTWILDKCIAKWPRFVNIQNISDVKLNYFILNGEWNLEKLEVIFGEQLMKTISAIHINTNKNSDLLELKCMFAGKSVTALAFEAAMVHEEEVAHWNWIKKLKRLSNFPGCPRGCGVDEDNSHLVGNCFKIRNVVSLLNSWGFIIPVFNSFLECLECLQRFVGKNSLSANIFGTSAYLVWKSRCKVVHGNKDDSDNNIASIAISFVVRSNFLNIQPVNWDANQQLLLSPWHPPPGWIKINVDAALKRNNLAGIGNVARDEKGRFLIAFGAYCLHWDISQLELLAVLYLKNVVKEWMFEAQGVIIKGDNFNIIKMLQNLVKSWKDHKIECSSSQLKIRFSGGLLQQRSGFSALFWRKQKESVLCRTGVGEKEYVGDALADLLSFVLIVQADVHIGLDDIDYMRVSTCKTGKEIWDKLCITYKGTNEVKQSRLNILLHDYELFRMKLHESISDMYTRFTQIVTSLHALGKELSNYEKVNKILRCLPSSYDAKITAITESKDLNTYYIDNLVGSLIAYKQRVNQRNLDAGEKKKEKIVALKAHKSDSQSSGSESDEVAFIIRQFKSFLRKKQKHHQNWRKGKDHKHSKGSSDVICYEYRKPGHMRTDCPILQDNTSKEKIEEKPKFKKDKKRIQKAFWAESGTEHENETTNLCLMGEDQSDEEEASGSSSRATLDPLLREAEDQAAYHRYKECGITLSRTINPAYLSYLIMDLFVHTSLYFILTLAVPFSSELLLEFYANLRINSTFTVVTSYVNRRPIDITYQDCAELLQLSTTGDKLHIIVIDPDFDWSTANHFLRQTNTPFQVGETSSLIKDARIIQHREFNATDLLFCYIDHLTTIHDPCHRRKPNLALGHLIAYILETKYNLQYPARHDLQPPCYSNNSFTILHSTHLHPGDGEGWGAEEEEAPAPVPDPVPLH